MIHPQTKLLKSFYSIYKYCSLVFVALQFIIVSPVFARSNIGQLHIPFGKTGIIVYDLRTGRMNVYKNNAAVFSKAYAQVKVNDKLISSKDYKSRTYIKTAINNGFGRGEKYMVKLTGGDLPEMCLLSAPIVFLPGSPPLFLWTKQRGLHQYNCTGKFATNRN